MATKYLAAGALAMGLLAASCARKPAAAPPAPPQVKQNVVVLLPEPDGAPSSIIVRNQAGSQALSQPYQAVRVERNDVAPGTPFAMDQTEVKRLFGTAVDAVPAGEVQFLLHFDENRDVLTAESEAMIPAVLKAIQEHRSTAISVTGHTDTTATPQYNYQLGLRRAQRVADILRAQGVNPSDLFVSSHGDADLLVKTARGVSEARNRRVEIIVR